MKKTILTAITAFALMAQPVFANTAIGFVNVTRIMQDSKAAASVRNQLQAKQKAFQTELDSKEKELLAEDQALIKQKDKVEKDAFDKKVKAFREKAAGAQRQVQEKKAQLDKAFGASLEEIQKSVIEIVKQVAAEKKLTLVLSSAQVLYGDTSLEITDEVLKRLDAKLPTIAVKF
jgi:outer membrane protein